MLSPGLSCPVAFIHSSEVAAEQRGEDVAVTESEKGAAKAEDPVDDIPYAGLVECLEN